MPTYEYECSACRKTFEVLQRIREEPLDACQLCGTKGTVRRLISKSMFVLQGGGWSDTGYSSEPPGKRRK